MKSILSILFFLLSLNLIGQSYQVIIDGRLPPGNQNGVTNYGDGTFTARGGSIDFSINNFSQENVQFREILDNQALSLLNLRIEYYPTCPNETFGKAETYNVSELIPSPSQNRMGISQCDAYISVDAIPENMNITTNTTTACAGGTIDLLNSDDYPIEARTWRYRIPAYQGYPGMSGYISDNFLSVDKKLASFTMQDLIGEETKNYIGSSVEFYMGYGGYRFSQSAQVLIEDCTPLAQVNPMNAACFDGTGYINLVFERGLRESENEYLLIELNNISDDFSIPLANDQINSLDNANGYSIPESLIPGAYQIQFQSWIDPDGFGGDDPYPNGLGFPIDFEILVPTPIVIDNLLIVHNPTCPDEFGERTIEVSGGRNFKNGVYHFTKDGGLNWDIPLDLNTLTYTYNDLIPGYDYTFGAKLIFTDGSGECISDSSIYQRIPDVLNPIMLSPNSGIANQPSSPTSNDGIIFAEVTGGTQEFTFDLYSASDPVNPISTIASSTRSHQFTKLGIGLYFLKIKDNNGCEVENESAPFELVASPPPTIASQQLTEIDCFGDSNGSVIINLSGGVSPYNYQWTINGATSPIQTTGNQTISLGNLSEPGEYIIKVASTGFTDFNDPPGYDTTTFTLNAPEEVIINSAIPNNISCNGAQDGSIAVTALGGLNYEYKLDFFGTWTPLNNGTIPITSGGFYDVYLRNQNNCESEPIMDILVIEPDEITVSWTSENANTNGGNQGSISLSIAGGTQFSQPADAYTITWTLDGQPFAPATGSTSTNIISLEAGEYIAQITDANGCSPAISPVITINQPGQLAISNINPTDVGCNGQTNGSITTTVIGQGNITSEWTMSDGSPILTSDGINSPNISGIAAGSYMLTISDGITTLVSEPILISEPATELELTNIIITNASCFGSNDGSLHIEVIGGTAPYAYSLDGTDYQNSDTFSNLPAGNYTIYVRDNNGCVLDSNTVLLVQPQQLNFTIDEQRPLSAAYESDGAIYITASGGTGNLNYSWTGPNGFSSGDEDLLDLAAGDYILTITDENYSLNNGMGCILVSSPITISEPGALLVELVETIMLECNGDDFGEITARVQGGVPPYAYEWFQTINGNNTALDEYTEIIGNLSVGEYFVRVTDANSVSTEALSINISQPNTLEINVNNVAGVLCNGSATGGITVSVSGGTGPYRYLWSNGSNSQNLIDVEAGDYTLEVYDDNGCFAEATVTIDAAPDPMRIVDVLVINNSRYMANDGSISLQIEGSAAPYDINWIRLSDNMPIGTGPEITNLSADTYEATITDANGCYVTVTYEITEPDIVEETITHPSCSGQEDGSIEVMVNQGNGIYTYTWNTGATTNYITNLAPGNYILTISGFGNGPLTRTYVIEEQIAVNVDLGEDRILCAGQELVLDAAIDITTATYTWTSDNGFSSSQPRVILNESGNYNLTITNENGCTATDSVFVDVTDDEINAEFAVSSQVFVGESVIAVDISYPLPDAQQWLLPDGATVLKQDSDEAELVFNEPGEYEISIITRIGECWAQQTKKVLVMANDALTSQDGNNDPRKLIEHFIVYPNPTSGEFVADINLSERGNISIKIFNFANNALMGSEKARGETSYSIPFDISGLPSGVYAVVLETSFGNSLRKVILK